MAKDKSNTKETWFTIQNKATKGSGGSVTVEVFGEIGYFGVTANDFRNQLKAEGDVTHIDLLIDSEGGDVFAGWSMVNALKDHPATVTARVVGMAASMASVLMLAADEVQVYENSWVMIHNPWTLTGGDAEDHEANAQNLRMVQAKIVRAYVEKTGMSEDEIQAMMKVESLFDGETAVQLGFADTLLHEFQAAALNSKFKELPRNLLPQTISEPKPLDNPKPQNTMSEPTAPTPVSEPEPKQKPISVKDALIADKPRREEIKAIGARFNLSHDKVEAAIENGVDLNQFRDEVVDNFSMDTIDPAKIEASKNVNDKDAAGYSVLKAIRESNNGGSLTGLEAEVQAELSNRYRAATGNPASGILVPGEWLAAKSPGIKNTASVGTGTSGGNAVATEMQGLTSYLDDYSILPKVGATIFRDSQGNLSFPRVTSAYSGSWDAEQDEITNADFTLAANLVMSPKRIGAGTSITKQLASQSSPDFETYMRDQLLYAIGKGVDRGAITGTGANDQPTGILSQSGLGSYTWVVGTSAWENVIAQWKVLRAANCPMQSVNWLFDENVRADWSGTPKVANASAFIYEQNGNAADGNVYGFPAYEHTDVTANKVILGDFSQLMLAMWGGIELIIDPFSEKKKGVIELYAQTFADIGVRQPGCFVIGDDGTSHAGAIA